VTKDEIRRAFIDFFVQRNHVLLPNLSLIPEDDTVLLTSAGVQQVQPFFLGLARPPAPRLVNVQRCLRTVDIEEIGDDTHLTFFEMMGNWSIGDYFKREAIAWSWELITAVLQVPKERLWVSVYWGANGRDDEAYDIWRETGVPAERIVWLGDEDNWWAPGDTGPCGPDTEMFYDRGAQFGCGRADCKPGCDCERFVEFWNNVFTQYNREADGTLTPLPSKNVDTGAGLERWCMLLQDKRSVYETDCFWPLIAAVAAATGTSYGAEARTDRSLRIIADHGRALTFLISDGVVPTPEGRGSVPRRLLRRAVLHGRLLALRRPFLAEIVVPAVVAMMKESYPELVERQQYIAEVAAREERQFLTTIERGFARAEDLVDRSRERGVVDGAEVFNLLQTHGFPLELTREIAAQRGVAIDMEGYERAEERHRTVSASEEEFFATARSNKAYGEIAARLGRPTEFVGYETLEATARVVGIVRNGASVREAQPGDTVQVVLDRTPFYAEAGGQVGDKGTLAVNGTLVQVTDTQRPKGSTIVVHSGTVQGGTLCVGDEVRASVDPALRIGAAHHHSATHLVHRALKDVLGEDVHQEGSVVEPERFTFDFNLPCAMTAAEMAAVEREVNQLVRDDFPVQTDVMAYHEAMTSGALALFTEKYGDQVRVVTMGPSRELCGGTHVHRTGEIGVFFILAESSVSAGIRRIECVAGEAAYCYARGQIDELRSLARELEAPQDQVVARVRTLRERLRALERQLNEARQEIANLKVQSLIAGTGQGDSGAPETADGFRILVQHTKADSLDDLKSQSDALKGRLAPCVVVLGAEVKGRAMFTAAVTKGLEAKGIRADNLVRAAAQAAGGNGGGRPTWAQGSAPDPGKVDDGLEAARALLSRWRVTGD
jgi:alanyl-tRNA synthetase